MKVPPLFAAGFPTPSKLLTAGLLWGGSGSVRRPCHNRESRPQALIPRNGNPFQPRVARFEPPWETSTRCSPGPRRGHQDGSIPRIAFVQFHAVFFAEPPKLILVGFLLMMFPLIFDVFCQP